MVKQIQASDLKRLELMLSGEMKIDAETEVFKNAGVKHGIVATHFLAQCYVVEKVMLARDTDGTVFNWVSIDTNPPKGHDMVLRMPSEYRLASVGFEAGLSEYHMPNHFLEDSDIIVLVTIDDDNMKCQHVLPTIDVIKNGGCIEVNEGL